MKNGIALPESAARVVFGGDVMLGRIVKDAIRRFGAQYPLGPVAGLMRDADLAVINLECAMTASEREWAGAPKAFYFGAPPEAIHALTDAGIDLVSLANNHLLDYDVAGLRDTLHYLRHAGIGHAGAGVDLAAALAPAIIARKGMRFGMASFCDHQADFAAGRHSPGIAWLDFDDEVLALEAWRRALASMQAAGVDWPILSLHWGPNMVDRPSNRFRRLAHAAIDMGWKILFGHSAHVFQGIEIHKGCPILYAAGDLVDDYRVDPDFRNDHQLLFEMLLSRNAVHRIRLHPVVIDDCQARPVTGKTANDIVSRMSMLCAELGTCVQKEDREAWIEVT
ncbi:MAG TPA: CapA family protein [Noviherbaspirillum sp.]